MSEKQTYTITQQLHRDGRLYLLGDSIELTEEEAQRLADHIDLPGGDVSAGDIDKAYAAFEEALNSAGKKIDELTAQLLEREKTIESLNGQLAEGEKELGELNITLTELRNTNTTLNAAVADRDSIIATRDNTIAALEKTPVGKKK